MGEGVRHATVFPFEKPAPGSRERDDSRAAVAKLQQFHVPVQRRTPPAVILSVHFQSIQFCDR
jgi:hypothetical protein